MKARILFQGLALIASMALLGYLFHASALGGSINEAWVDARVRGHGLNGALLLLLLGGVFTALGMPRQIVAFLAGYAFGVGPGTLLGTLAALLGCMLSFAYARMFSRKLLRARLGERAGHFDRFIHAHPFYMTVLVRLLPVGSNLLTNLAAGISGIRPAAFFAGSLLGYLPQALVFALLGSGVPIAPMVTLALSTGLFLLSGGFGVWLYRGYRHGQSLGAQIDAALDDPEPCLRASAAKS